MLILPCLPPWYSGWSWNGKKPPIVRMLIVGSCWSLIWWVWVSVSICWTYCVSRLSCWYIIIRNSRILRWRVRWSLYWCRSLSWAWWCMVSYKAWLRFVVISSCCLSIRSVCRITRVYMRSWLSWRLPWSGRSGRRCKTRSIRCGWRYPLFSRSYCWVFRVSVVVTWSPWSSRLPWRLICSWARR